MSQKKFRNSCMALFEKPNPDLSKIKYICWQEETCPTTGKIHYQTYVHFKDSYKLKDCQKYIGVKNCHIEAVKSKDLIIPMWYCKNNMHYEEYMKGNKKIDKKTTKDKTGLYIINSFVEYGEIPKNKGNQGKRTDLDEVKKMIKEGKSYDEIAEENPNMIIRYSKGIKELITIRNKENTKDFRDVKVILLWGNAGSGKSREVYKIEGVDKVYKLDKAKNEAWFCGYNQEKVLLIDDFYGWLNYDLLLNILDGYRLRIQVKYGYDWANWDKVYITSNKHYTEWYNKDDKDLEPLTRRITFETEINRKQVMRRPRKLSLEELKNMLNDNKNDN